MYVYVLLQGHTNNRAAHLFSNTYATKQKARLTSTDGASQSEGGKWAEAAAAGVRMGK